MTSSDIDFHIYFFPSKTLLHYIDNTTGFSGKTLSSPERMWLGKCISIHWYVCNSGYLIYLQIVHLLKRGVYHLRAPRLLVRLRSRLDAIGLLPLWRRQLPHWIVRVLARWQKPLAGRPMTTRLDGCTSWRLGFNTQLDAWKLSWVEPSLELTERCIWCKIRSIKWQRPRMEDPEYLEKSTA